jgi:uncharacterized GH25 family protein
MKRTIIPSLILGAAYMISSSHFIWLETPALAEVGRDHPVNLFYGEYADQLKEEAGKRLEEVNGLRAFYLDAQGKQIELKADKVTKGYTSSFRPASPGLHQMLAVNDVKEVVDFSKYDIGIVKPVYYSRAFIYAKDRNSNSAPSYESVKPLHDLDILPLTNPAESNTFRLNEKVKLGVFFKKAGLTKAKINVFAPNGWMKEIDCNEKGEAECLPAWEGLYVIECIYKERTPGEYKGKNYEAIRHRAILSFQVKK